VSSTSRKVPKDRLASSSLYLVVIGVAIELLKGRMGDRHMIAFGIDVHERFPIEVDLDLPIVAQGLQVAEPIGPHFR
jgi:hypothetical protein